MMIYEFEIAVRVQAENATEAQKKIVEKVKDLDYEHAAHVQLIGYGFRPNKDE